MKKKWIAILLISLLTLSLLAACGNSSSKDDSSDQDATAEESGEDSDEAEGAETSADGDKVISVGASPVPHADILDNVVKDVLAQEGWELKTVVFEDYVLPNTSLEEGELDANYFQTLGYMNQQNDEVGLHLAAVAGVHIEPMGIYSQKYTSLDEIPDGGEIGIPNDPDNAKRGLELLVQKGLLTSIGSYGEDLDYTEASLTSDAEANPHGYVITPLEAASLPLALPDLDAAAINGNYALGADLPATYPALDIEEFDDDTSVRRTNFIVVRQGEEDSEKVQALVAAIQSDEVQAYIEDVYKGAVITSFIDPE